MIVETEKTIFFLYPYGRVREASNPIVPVPLVVVSTPQNLLVSSSFSPYSPPPPRGNGVEASYDRNVGRFSTPTFRLVILTLAATTYVSLAGSFQIEEWGDTNAPLFTVTSPADIPPFIEELRSQGETVRFGLNGVYVEGGSV